jgi:hypothetical protein
VLAVSRGTLSTVPCPWSRTRQPNLKRLARRRPWRRAVRRRSTAATPVASPNRTPARFAQTHQRTPVHAHLHFTPPYPAREEPLHTAAPRRRRAHAGDRRARHTPAALGASEPHNPRISSRSVLQAGHPGVDGHHRWREPHAPPPSSSWAFCRALGRRSSNREGRGGAPGHI